MSLAKCHGRHYQATHLRQQTYIHSHDSTSEITITNKQRHYHGTMASSWYIDTTVSDMVSMYHATGSVSMDVGHLPLLALLSGTLCPMTCGIRRFLRTATDSRAPSNKKWNFRTQFLENFRTFLSVSRGSRHRKAHFYVLIYVIHWSRSVLQSTKCY